MTAEELRKLDAEVHRAVFGVESRPLRYALQFPEPELRGKEILDRPYAVSGAEKLPDRGRYVPRYSEDIAAAWLVVEKLMPRVGHVYPAFDVVVPRKFMHWTAVLEDGHGWNRRGFTAETAPLAICRAALACVAAATGGG
jgi:hypothetical protein